MEQLECKRTITFRWWRGNGQAIKPEHVEPLKEIADERIHEMMTQGFMSGELNGNVHTTEEDPEDGVEYTGWWEVKEE